jgi:hypothetical protein
MRELLSQSLFFEISALLVLAAGVGLVGHLGPSVAWCFHCHAVGAAFPLPMSQSKAGVPEA